MFILTEGTIFNQYVKKIIFSWNKCWYWYWSLETAAVVMGILSWTNVLLQILVLYTCPPKVWFSISMWKSSYFYSVTIEGVWKLQVLLQILIFHLKYLCIYQLCIYVDLSHSSKLSHEKIKSSLNIYWNWIKGILRDKFLVELIPFCRYQEYISYGARIQFSISMW